MSESWLNANADIFVRDIVRDFCTVYAALEEQKRRFDDDGSVSYAALRDLLGQAARKGVFWRLKDTSHLLFRNAGGAETADAGDSVVLWQYASSRLPDGETRQGITESMLDWCVGYAFHDCVKLKEDAFLQQHYSNQYAIMRRTFGIKGDLFASFDALTGQNCESIGRELTRIMDVLDKIRTLLVEYLASQGNNCCLARFLYVENRAAKQVFGSAWPALLAALYGENRGRLYELAAKAFSDGGRPREAQRVLEERARLLNS